MPTDPERQIADDAALTLTAMRTAYASMQAGTSAAIEHLAIAEIRCRRMADALRRRGATEAEVDELVNGDIDVVFRRSA